MGKVGASEGKFGTEGVESFLKESCIESIRLKLSEGKLHRKHMP